MIQGTTIIDDWIAEGEARGEARGHARGEARGRVEEARRLVRQTVLLRFDILPESVASRIDSADVAECERLHAQAIKASLLDELTR